MNSLSKKIILMIGCIFVFMLLLTFFITFMGNKNQNSNVANAVIESSQFKQTKSVSALNGERLDSDKEYSSYDYIIFSDVSKNSLHAKDGINLKTDFALSDDKVVSWSILRSNALYDKPEDITPSKKGVGYVLLTVDKNDTNKVNIKCLKPFSCVFVLSATYEDEVKTFEIAFSETITSCDFVIVDTATSQNKRFNAFTSNRFDFGEMLLSENTIFNICNFKYSSVGRFVDNGMHYSAKIVVDESALAHLSKFTLDNYGLSLVCLDGDFDNLVDCLKVQNADTSLFSITEYSELINEIKNYNGQVCSIEFLLESQTQSYSNVFSVSFN